MVMISEQEALSLLEELATAQGLSVVRSDMERSESLASEGIANLYVEMGDAAKVHAAMLKLEAAINRTWGGESRTGLYYAGIGYDEVPEGQAQIQIDLLPFSLQPPAPGPVSL